MVIIRNLPGCDLVNHSTRKQHDDLVAIDHKRLDLEVKPQFWRGLPDSVGRPGLDPRTLGFEPGRTEASVVVRVSWSEDCQRPPTSAKVLSNVMPWLHHARESGAGGHGLLDDAGEVHGTLASLAREGF
jgi:hypothetical protein